MTYLSAQNFLDDTRRELTEDDLHGNNVYISIRGIGTKVYKNAVTRTEEGWVFIWSESDSFCVQQSEVGDMVCVNASDEITTNLTTI